MGAIRDSVTVLGVRLEVPGFSCMCLGSADRVGGWPGDVGADNDISECFGGFRIDTGPGLEAPPEFCAPGEVSGDGVCGLSAEIGAGDRIGAECVRGCDDGLAAL